MRARKLSKFPIKLPNKIAPNKNTASKELVLLKNLNWKILLTRSTDDKKEEAKKNWSNGIFLILWVL